MSRVVDLVQQVQSRSNEIDTGLPVIVTATTTLPDNGKFIVAPAADTVLNLSATPSVGADVELVLRDALSTALSFDAGAGYIVYSITKNGVQFVSGAGGVNSAVVITDTTDDIISGRLRATYYSSGKWVITGIVDVTVN